jgi:hypothetical protein
MPTTKTLKKNAIKCEFLLNLIGSIEPLLEANRILKLKKRVVKAVKPSNQIKNKVAEAVKPSNQIKNKVAKAVKPFKKIKNMPSGFSEGLNQRRYCYEN